MSGENLNPIFKSILDSQLSIHSVNNLLPCPFCGGEVVEENPQWNMANAKCTSCDEKWGHCGSKYGGRFDKWNVRAK